MVELLVGVAGLYVIVAGSMFVLQRRLIYLPDRRVFSPADMGLPEMTVVEYTTPDALPINGWLSMPRQKIDAGMVVYFHGNAGSIADRGEKVRPFLQAGYGALLAGYRGYAGNPGRPTEAGLFDDARGALNYVASLGIAPERTVVYGESLGSGVAVAMAAERNLGALVLEAPFTSIVDVAAAAYPWLPVRWAMIDRFDSLSRIADIGAPKLILHGELDQTVPIRLGRRLLEQAGEPKSSCFFAGAGHTDLHDHGAVEEVLGFLERMGFAQSGS